MPCLCLCLCLKPDSGVRLIVHQSHAGAIIGRAGYKIKDLRQVIFFSLQIFAVSSKNSVHVNFSKSRYTLHVLSFCKFCGDSFDSNKI